jgi:hypothetical protein
MPDNPTRLEAGHNHVLAYCHRCPSWRTLAGDRPEAQRAAAQHVLLVHGQTKLANSLRDSAKRYAERHAAD